MFEEMTYENILEGMLQKVTSDVDKREGSIIYDALAPCAYHLAENYFMLNNFIDLVSGDTAVAEYLDRVVADYGIVRKPSTKAVRLILTNIDVPIGTRWGMNAISYVITEQISKNKYKAECEQFGEIGNTYTGNLENIDNVSGVTASLDEIIISGQDEESDDNLRERFYAYIQRPSTSGNTYNYREWAMLVPGVGDAKVFPLWNGPGTVKVVIVDSDKQPVSEGLMNETAILIDNMRPIGADVTVVSGVAKKITISANLKLSSGINIQSVTNSFQNAMIEYFKNVAFTQTNYISLAKVGTILLGIDGVLDYSDLKLNNLAQNVALGDEEIPTLGEIELGV